MSQAERQAEWSRARDRKMQIKSEALAKEAEKDHTFKPKLATRRTPRHDVPVRRYSTPRSDVTPETLDDSDDEEESFFVQLQRERKQWDAEHEKLVTVIELQQRELQQRGIKAEEKARDIARHFADSVANFEDRVVRIEKDVANELAALRQLFTEAFLHRIQALEAQVKALNTTLDANAQRGALNTP